MPEWVRWAGAELDLEAVWRLLLAVLLGAIIGFERERSQKAAGLRTNILICLGSTLVMEVSRVIAEAGGNQVDPTRMAAQVVSGIGFIGAGTILVARGRVVVGLTTAATIWVVAAVGLAVGAQAYTHAVLTTLLIFIVLSLLGRVEDLLFEQGGTEILELYLLPDTLALERVRELLAGSGVVSRLTEIEKRNKHVKAVLELRGSGERRDQILDKLTRDADIQKINLLAVKPAK